MSRQRPLSPPTSDSTRFRRTRASSDWPFQLECDLTMLCIAGAPPRILATPVQLKKRATLIGSRTNHRGSGIMTGWWVADQGLQFPSADGAGKVPGASPHPKTNAPSTPREEEGKPLPTHRMICTFRCCRTRPSKRRRPRSATSNWTRRRATSDGGGSDHFHVSNWPGDPDCWHLVSGGRSCGATLFFFFLPSIFRTMWRFKEKKRRTRRRRTKTMREEEGSGELGEEGWEEKRREEAEERIPFSYARYPEPHTPLVDR